MRKLWLLTIVLALLLQLASTASSTNDTSAEARIAKLEARVDLLEAWAIRYGGKLK